jgi:ferredoxin
MATVELSAEELKLVKANLSYAIENCPVEGGIMTEDGTLSSEESFKAMLKKLEAVQVKPANRLDLSGEEVELLVATAEYALANCPVEGIMTEDGYMASRELFRALQEKLKSFRKRP